MTDLLAGYKAAASGAARDATRSSDWLEGFDGFAIGQTAVAERDAANAPLVERARRQAKAKLRRRCHSTTPRSL